MALDPSIIGGIRPIQIDSPVNALAQVLRVQGMQQETQLGQAKLDEYTRGKARQNMLYDAMQKLGAGANADQRIGTLESLGEFDQADKIRTGVTNRRKVESEASEREWKVKKEKLTMAGQAFFGVVRNPTLENAMGTLDYLGQEGLMPPGMVERYRAGAQADPSKIGMYAEQAYRSILDADKQLDNVLTNNLGATTQTLGVDPVTGKSRVLHTAVNTQSPDNAATVAAARDNANATRAVAAATRDAAMIRRDQDTEMKLADDYRIDSKGFAETSTAMKKVFGAISTADKNPGSALAAGTAFMKILDPNSVVRESELGMALNASGWFDRATNLANTLQNGRTMTPTQQKNLRTAAEDLFEEAKAAQREIDDAYRQRATGYGVESQRVIVDRGQNTPRATAAQKQGAAPAKPAATGAKFLGFE